MQRLQQKRIAGESKSQVFAQGRRAAIKESGGCPKADHHTLHMRRLPESPREPWERPRGFVLPRLRCESPRPLVHGVCVAGRIRGDAMSRPRKNVPMERGSGQGESRHAAVPSRRPGGLGRLARLIAKFGKTSLCVFLVLTAANSMIQYWYIRDTADLLTAALAFSSVASLNIR